MSTRLLTFVLVLGCVGCFDNKEPPAKDIPAGSARATTPFDDHMLEVAKRYESYRLLVPNLNIVATDCRPIGFADTSLYFSKSTDSQTHGKKMYVVFAKDVPDGVYSYVPKGNAAPLGQAIVKEAWTAEEVVDDNKALWTMPSVRRKGNPTFVPYLRKDGKLYHAAEKSALFIMFKLDPQTPDTDEGWVYGTVTPDGKMVTSAGKVESCMKCHQKAPHDRLFGLPADK